MNEFLKSKYISRIIHPYTLFFALIAITYLQSFNFEFLWWDDRENIFDNYFLQNFNWTYFWENSYYGLYIPIPYTIWTFLWKLVPNQPSWFHLLNVAVHFINCILVYKVATALYPENKKSAIFGTLLFLIHPLQVETVVWTSGLRDTLGYAFALTALLYWIRAGKAVTGKSWLAFILFNIALLCKPTVSIIPVVFILINYGDELIEWFENKFKLFNTKLNIKTEDKGSEDNLETKNGKPLSKKQLKSHKNQNKKIMKKNSRENLALPFICIFTSLIAIYNSSKIQETFIRQDSVVEWYERPIVALDALGFYVLKFIKPFPLSAEYGRIPKIVLEEKLYYTPLIIASTFLILTIGLILYLRSKNKTANRNQLLILFGVIILFYLPTSGIFGFAYQNISTTADRYFYAPLIGIALLLSSFKLSQKYWVFIFIIIITYFGYFNFVRTQDWKNNESFFGSMIQFNPKSYSAHLNFANIERQHNNLDKALFHFRKAHEIRPDELGPISGEMLIHGFKGDFNTITRLYNETLPRIPQMKTSGPHLSVFNAVYGFVNIQNGNLEGAFDNYCKSIKFDPSFHEGRKNLEAVAQQLRSKNKPIPPCE